MGKTLAELLEKWIDDPEFKIEYENVIKRNKLIKEFVENIDKSPWQFVLTPERDGNEWIYICEVAEFPGLKTDGKTPEEAITAIRGVLIAAVELNCKLRKQTPDPFAFRDFIPFEEARKKGKTDWQKLRKMSEEEIETIAKNDLDAPLQSKEQLKRFRRLK